MSQTRKDSREGRSRGLNPERRQVRSKTPQPLKRERSGKKLAERRVKSPRGVRVARGARERAETVSRSPARRGARNRSQTNADRGSNSLRRAASGRARKGAKDEERGGSRNRAPRKQTSDARLDRRRPDRVPPQKPLSIASLVNATAKLPMAAMPLTPSQEADEEETPAAKLAKEQKAKEGDADQDDTPQSVKIYEDRNTDDEFEDGDLEDDTEEEKMVQVRKKPRSYSVNQLSIKTDESPRTSPRRLPKRRSPRQSPSNSPRRKSHREKEQEDEFARQKKKLKIQRKNLEQEKLKLRYDKQNVQADRRRLEQERKQLRSEKARLKQESSQGKQNAVGDGLSQSRGAMASEAVKYREKWEAESSKRRELVQKNEILEANIRMLKRRVRSESRNNMRNDKKWKNAMKQLQRELNSRKRQLRLALADYEKTVAYYRRQLKNFNAQQKAMIQEQRKRLKTNVVIEYVWADSIKKIRLQRYGKSGGIKIWTRDGDEAIMPDVDVELPDEKDDGYANMVEKMQRAASGSEEDSDLEAEFDTMYNDGQSNGVRRKSRKNTASSSPTDDLDDEDLDDSFEKNMTEMLFAELEQRNRDMRALANVVFQRKYLAREENAGDEKEYVRLGDGLCPFLNEIAERHAMIKREVFKNAPFRVSVEEASPEAELKTIADDEEYAANDLGHSLVSNNNVWREAIKEFPFDVLTVMGLELDDRIGDLGHIAHLLGTASPRKQKKPVVESFAQLIKEYVSSRHQEVFTHWSDQALGSWEDVIDTVEDNNTRWRKALRKLGRHKPEKLRLESNALSFVDTEDDTPSEVSWLKRNAQMKDFVKRMEFNSSTSLFIRHIGRYLNRILPNQASGVSTKLLDLYLPIGDGSADDDMSMEQDILLALTDGVLLSMLVNFIKPGYVDLRAIHIPDVNAPSWLAEEEIRDNIRLVLSSTRALGVKIPRWTVHDYFDVKQTATIIVALVVQLFNSLVSSLINMDRFPELTRLCEHREDLDECHTWSGREWLRRWVSRITDGESSPVYTGHRRHESVNTMSMEMTLTAEQVYGDSASEDEAGPSHRIGRSPHVHSDEMLTKSLLYARNWHSDMIKTCSKMDLRVAKQLREIHGDDEKEAQTIMDFITGPTVRAKTFVTVGDLAVQNPLLQEILMCHLFTLRSQLKPLDSRAATDVKTQMQDSEDATVVAWMNSLSGEVHVQDLFRDVSDGVVILKLLDAAKSGCVNWTRVRNPCRHQFDKMSNCNYALEIGNTEFKLVLVGIDGKDIVDSNQKFIRTVLWQIMRFHATKIVRDAFFKGHAVTDDDIVKWSNARIEKFGCSPNAPKLLSRPIRSFRDQNLSSCLYYCDLLASINPAFINYEMLNTDLDASSLKRVQNARYVMTVVRRLGAELFAMVEDLVRVKPRAVLSMLACIMTIQAKYEKGILNFVTQENHVAGALNGQYEAFKLCG